MAENIAKLENAVATLQGERIGLDIDNFVLRGSTLRRTSWVLGIVCYAGENTKLKLNSINAEAKMSDMYGERRHSPKTEEESSLQSHHKQFIRQNI